MDITGFQSIEMFELMLNFTREIFPLAKFIFYSKKMEFQTCFRQCSNCLSMRLSVNFHVLSCNDNSLLCMECHKALLQQDGRNITLNHISHSVE